MPDVPGESVERLLAGELSPPEQRRLAQAALDDPDLFDALTAAALAKTALTSQHDRETGRRPASAPATARWFGERRARVLAVIGLAAAAMLVVAIGYGGHLFGPASPPSSAALPANVPARGDSAAPGSASTIATPLLLTAHFGATTGRSASTFRTESAPTRVPRSSGTVLSVQDGGTVEIDLGSLDGMRESAQLRVFHEGKDAAAIGRITITAVFRERSRGRAQQPGALQTGDRIEVAAGIHASAILEQAEARRLGGDAAGARTLVETALSLTQGDVPPDVRRRALHQFGVLLYQNGALGESERNLRAAADLFDAAPIAPPAERADILNELGALQIEQRDLASADRTLQAARAHATDGTRVRVTNNLAALAALRGDRAAAETLYREARSLAGDSPAFAADRRAIDDNLQRLTTTR